MLFRILAVNRLTWSTLVSWLTQPIMVRWQIFSVPGQIALAGVVCVLDPVLRWEPTDDPIPINETNIVLGSVLVAFSLLLLCRRFPLGILAVWAFHSLLLWKLQVGYTPTLGVWLALYVVASSCGPRTSAIGLLLGFAPTAFGYLDLADEIQRSQGNSDISTIDFIFFKALSVSFTLALFGAGSRVALSIRQQQRARQAGLAAATAERARIARELHDIVAHAITLMLLQAGGAAKLLPTNPDRAVTALRHVDELGQQAIVELRRMLGLLNAGAAGHDVADQPIGLARVDRIVNQFNTPDLQVELIVVGQPVDLEAGVDVSAYRIVQEALTNAARHADIREPVVLRVLWGPERVQITVTNLRRKGSSWRGHRLSTGHGLIGIRERTATCGGDFQAGPQPDGRFTMTVTLPLARTHADA